MIAPATAAHPVRALLSFHSFRTQDVGALYEACTVDGVTPDLFADSGAYSAYSVGVPIVLDDYVAWLNRWDGLFTVIANLDVIGNHHASMQNLRELERQGVNALPVFHTTTEDFGLFEDLCEEYDYVAVGGMVAFSTSTGLFPWLVKVHKIARKHGTRLHGFGQTKWSYLLDLPWYTVDSSSWGGGHRWGRILLIDTLRGRTMSVPLGDRKKWSQYATLVREYGFDPADFYDRDRNTLGKILGLAMASWRTQELYLRERHGVMTGPTGDGLRMYAAEGSGANIAKAVEMGVRRYVPGYTPIDITAPAYVPPADA